MTWYIILCSRVGEEGHEDDRAYDASMGEKKGTLIMARIGGGRT